MKSPGRAGPPLGQDGAAVCEPQHTGLFRTQLRLSSDTDYKINAELPSFCSASDGGHRRSPRASGAYCSRPIKTADLGTRVASGGTLLHGGRSSQSYHKVITELSLIARVEPQNV